MQTNNVIGSTSAERSAPAQIVQPSSGRKLIYGAYIAVLGSAVMVLSSAGTSPVPASFVVSSIEGNVIVAFDPS